MKKYIAILTLILNVFLSYDLKAIGCSEEYDYILFDLDRTLLDFDASATHALDKIYEKYFNNIKKEELITAFHEVNDMCWKNFEEGKYTLNDVRQKRFPILLSQLKIKNLDPVKITKDYELYLAEKAEWLPDTNEHFFKIAKNHKIAIITNGYELVQGTRIKDSGIAKATVHIFTSEAIGHSKPNPLYFQHVFKEMGIDPQEAKVLVVGDSLSSDYQGALNIKADFCWVNQKAQPLPEKYPQPNCTVKNIKELYEIMEPSSLVLQ